MRRIDGQRREHREDLGGEVVGQPHLVLVLDRTPPDDADTGVLERGHHVVGEAAALPLDQFLGARGDERQLLGLGETVGAGQRQAHVPAPHQTGHPDHVELVQVRREDRQELGPLEQRLFTVLGQRQHPLVEVEPAQLPVGEPVFGQRLVVQHGQRRLRLDRLWNGSTAGASTFGPRRQLGRTRRGSTAAALVVAGRARGVGSTPPAASVVSRFTAAMEGRRRAGVGFLVVVTGSLFRAQGAGNQRGR